MNELFKHIKPNPYPLCTKYGYGCISVTRGEYYKANRRKVLRYIRHYGFDISETWNLDRTIMKWLSDHVGGFFRECGCKDTWNDVDFDGNGWDVKEITISNLGIYNNEALLRCIEAEGARTEEYLKQLEQWLGTTQQYSEFIEFVIPRLIYLAQHSCGYPAYFGNFEEWQKMLKSIVVDFQKHKFDNFVKYFFNLWD